MFKKKKENRRWHKCRNRMHGNPKYGEGICRQLIREAVVERIEGKRLCAKWLSATVVDDEDL